MAILNMFGGAGGGVRIPLESPTVFTASPQDGKVILTWTDPVDKVANPGGEMVAPWSYTIVVRKVGSYPQTPKDGVEVTRETTRNQYQTTGYTDTLSIENDITYYYALFAVSTFGVWSEPATATAKPTGIHPQFYKTETVSSTERNQSWKTLSSTQNHFILAGAVGGSEYESSSFYGDWMAYDKNLSRKTVSNTPADGLLTPGKFNGNAVFVSGMNGLDSYSDLWVVNPSLTVRGYSIDNAKGNTQMCVGVGSSDSHLILAGGDEDAAVTAFNTSFSQVSVPQLSNTAIYYTGTHVGDHIIFGGGAHTSNDFVANSFAYSDTLTKVENLSPLYQQNLETNTVAVDFKVGAASTGNYALFGGGSGNENYPNQWSNVVTAYDQSLTRQSQLTLNHKAYCFASAVDVGAFALFGYYIASGEDPGNFAATCFNNTLTKISNIGTITQGTEAYYNQLIYGSGFVDDFAVFMADQFTENDVYMFQYA